MILSSRFRFLHLPMICHSQIICIPHSCLFIVFIIICRICSVSLVVLSNHFWKYWQNCILIESFHLPFSFLSFSCLITMDLGVCRVCINRAVALCRLFPAVSRMCCFGPAADVCSHWILPVLSRLRVDLIESE